MGITLAEIKRRWEAAKSGLNDAAGEILQQHEAEIVDLNRQQLYEKGIDGFGDELPTYKRDKYARRKNQMNPLPGYGTPDLRLTGSFYAGFNLQADGNTMIIGSSDQKSPNLSKKYGLRIFRLTIASKNTVRKSMLQPGLVQYLRRETGAR